MNVDGSGLQRLTTAGTFWAPQFSPDGTHLAVQGDRDIRVITLADKAVKRLRSSRRTAFPELVARRLADGVREHAQRTSRDLHDAGGRLEPGHAVSMPGASVLDPRWSPDGARVAFVQVPTLDERAARDTSQPYAIYVIEVESRRVRRLSP